MLGAGGSDGGSGRFSTLCSNAHLLVAGDIASGRLIVRADVNVDAVARTSLGEIGAGLALARGSEKTLGEGNSVGTVITASGAALCVVVASCNVGGASEIGQRSEY